MKSQQQPNRAVFAVTSQGNDIYSAMTRVAVASLRVSNPGMRVVISCDRESDDAMRAAGDPLPADADEWIAVDTPPGDAGFRNRYIKIGLRSLIAGPFLFLDSDIFVRGDLGEIFALDCDIAGARNHSREAFAEQIWDQDRATLAAMGWDIGDTVYINGGVLFCNDTEGARRFAAEWQRRWSESSSGRNYHRDQPALNSALHATQPKLVVLPDRFNAQILSGPNAAVDAVIWHYYSSARRPTMTTYDALVQKVLHGARIDLDEIRRMADCRHPWLTEELIDVWKEIEALRKEIRNVSGDRENVRRDLENARRDLENARRDFENARRDLENVLTSRSWLVTKPLRAIDALRRRLLTGSRSAATHIPPDQ